MQGEESRINGDGEALVQARRESTFSQPPIRRRRWLRRLLMLPVLFVLVSVLQVLVLRFIDPPFSTVMAGRQLSAWADGGARRRR